MLCNKEFENEQTQSSAMVLKKKERKKERKKEVRSSSRKKCIINVFQLLSRSIA